MSAPATSPIPTPGDLARRHDPTTATAEAVPSPATPAADREAQQPVWQRPLYEPRPLTAEEAIRPGILTDTEYFQAVFRWCLTRSSLPPHARLVAHDLLHRASHTSGRLGPKNQPAVRQLAVATGLTEMQASVALNVLASRGWIAYRPEVPEDKRSLYDLVVPALELERARGRRFLHQD